MESILLGYGPLGVMVVGMAGVCVKLYSDSKAKDAIIKDISQARVEDLKEINASKDAAGEKLSQMVTLIYNKLEGEKRGK